MASWKILEDLLITLKRKNIDIPAKVVEDLRAAKSMIQLGCMEDSRGEVLQKAEEYTANVEAYLISEAQKVLAPEAVNDWLKRLEGADTQECIEEPTAENKFVVGVPRDQKWVRVEPTESFPAERLEKLAAEKNLSFNKQADGKFVIYGQKEGISAFIKQMVAEKPKTN
jgi:hypothetical protein